MPLSWGKDLILPPNFLGSSTTISGEFSRYICLISDGKGRISLAI